MATNNPTPKDGERYLNFLRSSNEILVENNIALSSTKKHLEYELEKASTQISWLSRVGAEDSLKLQTQLDETQKELEAVRMACQQAEDDGKPKPIPEGIAATTEHLEAQNQTMGVQLAEAYEELAVLEKFKSDSVEANSVLSQKLGVAEAENKRLENEVERMKTANGDMYDRMSIAQAKSRHLQEELGTSDERIKELENEIAKVIGEREEAEAKVEERNKQIHKERDDANAEVEQLRKQIHEQARACEQTLKAEREVLAKQRDEAKAKVTNLQTELSIAREQLKDNRRGYAKVTPREQQNRA